MIIQYYEAAFARSLSWTWNWAISQGITLTLALAVCALACTAILAVVRAHRKKHTWDDAVTMALNGGRDFFTSVVAAALLLLGVLFAIAL